MPLQKDDPIPQFGSVLELGMSLHSQGCQRCSLGFQKEINGCCVYRGSTEHRRMIIGEAPGREEDSRRSPFTGPAGQLMDKIFASVDLNTQWGFYITNVVKCRPYMPRGSGKENFTPKVEQQKLCRPFLDQEIKLVNPRLIVLLGKVAVDNLLPEFRKEPMRALRGRIVRKDGIVYFIMLHPAAILHAAYDKELEALYKEYTYQDIQALRELIIQENL